LEANPPLLCSYGLQPRPVLQLRQLALLWRRLRRNQRLGVKQELDLQASLRDRCEQGVLLRPVLRPCRRNTAKPSQARSCSLACARGSFSSSK
jgi:hypothetical protein